jgi:hypothetical protein
VSPTLRSVVGVTWRRRGAKGRRDAVADNRDTLLVESVRGDYATFRLRRRRHHLGCRANRRSEHGVTASSTIREAVRMRTKAHVVHGDHGRRNQRARQNGPGKEQHIRVHGH